MKNVLRYMVAACIILFAGIITLGMPVKARADGPKDPPAVPNNNDPRFTIEVNEKMCTATYIMRVDPDLLIHRTGYDPVILKDQPANTQITLPVKNGHTQFIATNKKGKVIGGHWALVNSENCEGKQVPPPPDEPGANGEIRVVKYSPNQHKITPSGKSCDFVIAPGQKYTLYRVYPDNGKVKIGEFKADVNGKAGNFSDYAEAAGFEIQGDFGTKRVFKTAEGECIPDNPAPPAKVVPVCNIIGAVRGSDAVYVSVDCDPDVKVVADGKIVFHKPDMANERARVPVSCEKVVDVLVNDKLFRHFKPLCNK